MKAIFLTGLFLVALSAPILAATLGTPTLSLDETALTTGTTRTVTVSLSSTGGTATASTVGFRGTGQSTGSSITVTDPSTGTYSSVAVTTSATKDFTVTAGTADTYSLVGWAIGTSDTSEKASLESYLTFTDPSVITLTVSTDPSGMYKYGESLTYAVKLRNTLGSSVTTSYNLTGVASTLTKTSGDPTAATITLTAGQSYPLSWTYSVGSAYSGDTFSFLIGTEPKDTVTLTAYPACNNSVDDDSDGYTDYPSDTGCSGYTDTSETTATTSTGGSSSSFYLPREKETAQQKTLSTVDTLIGDAKILIATNPTAARQKLTSAESQQTTVVGTARTDVMLLDDLKTLELTDIGLLSADLAEGKALLAEVEKLLNQAKAEADLSKKADLLDQANTKQKTALDKLPEVEKLAETSDKKEITASEVASALEAATDETAKAVIQSIQKAVPKTAGKVSISRSLATYKITNKEKTATEEKRSKISLRIEAKEALKDVEVVEVIPKSVAQNVAELLFGEAPRVLQADPIVMWAIPSLRAGESRDLSYVVKKSLTELESTTIAKAEVAPDATSEEPTLVEEKEEAVIAPVPTEEASAEKPKAAGISKSGIYTLLAVLLVFAAAGTYLAKKQQG